MTSARSSGPLDVAVLGTGTVGRTVAAGLARLGHRVTVGTRDPDGTAAREEYAAWAADHADVRLATFADAAAGAGLVVNASSGQVTLDVLEQAGHDNLAGKVVVDISNPLDFSRGFPPTLFVKDDDSLGEQVQRAVPGARVVKTLNTLTAALMTDPASLGEPTTVFVSGDDADAKAFVTGLLHDLGHADVIDLGGIETARGPEMWLPLWLRTMGALGTAGFNLRIVR
ncbi:NADPH-dependent F420 reductase [Nocardioides sp. GCM10027113]|uniref:NADPH-dependent F420 reductase n=1 Tax=unclassified Nocardioides TaxID=2615069 RepID=UPI0036107181